MGDADLQELERRAGEGPEAYRAWVAELVRQGHELAVEAEDFGAQLDTFVARGRDLLLAETEGWRVEVPLLASQHLLPAIREALEPIAAGFEGTGVGFRTFGRFYNPETQKPDEIQFEAPLVPLVFVADFEGQVVFGFSGHYSRKPTPGTAFSALRPWRAKIKPETLQKRLKKWRDETEDLLRAPRGLVEIWVAIQELAGPQAEFEEPRRDPTREGASEKQVGFIESLKDQKGLDDEAFLALVKTQSALESAANLEALGRGEASGLIEALLALPDRKRRRAAKAVAPPADEASHPFGEQPDPQAGKQKAKKKAPGAGKVPWEGVVLAVQPRISMTILGADEQHGYKGYTLYLRGKVEEVEREFSVGIGKAAQAKHGFQVGVGASGAGAPAPPSEGIDLYKASKLARVGEAPGSPGAGPPYLGLPLELPAYRAQGHRTLAPTALDGPPCAECIHGCLMPVDEHGERTLSAECYGPHECPAFVAGSR